MMEDTGKMGHQVRCQDCQYCSADFLMLPTGTYRMGLCQLNIMTPLMVDAGALRECGHYQRKEEVCSTTNEHSP